MQKISTSTGSRIVKKVVGKSVGRSMKLLLSAAMVQKCLERSTRLLNDLNHGTRILLFFDEKTFPIEIVFNKQNDQIVKFENDVLEHCSVSKTKNAASIIMLGVLASNEEKMPPV